MPCLPIAVAFTVAGVVVALSPGVRSVLDRDVVVANRRGGRGGIQSVALQPVSSMEHVRSVGSDVHGRSESLPQADERARHSAQKGRLAKVLHTAQIDADALVPGDARICRRSAHPCR